MEAVEREVAAFAGVGKVHRLGRLHGHEDLHEREEPGEHALVGVLLYLVACLGDGHATALELDVDERHAVDEKGQVATAIVESGGTRLEDGLLGDLVDAPAASDVATVVYVQAHLAVEVRYVIGVVAGDGDGPPVDEAVEPHGRTQLRDLLQDLLHLTLGEWASVQPPVPLVVLVEDVRPVVQEALLGGLAQHAALPAVVLETRDHSRLELSLRGKDVRHHSPFPLSTFR